MTIFTNKLSVPIRRIVTQSQMTWPEIRTFCTIALIRQEELYKMGEYELWQYLDGLLVIVQIGNKL